MTCTQLRTTFVAALMLTTALHAQSLADAAKTTAEQRAKTKQDEAQSDAAKKTDKPSATKAYTNRDLASVPVTGSASGAALAPVAETAVKESTGKGEDWLAEGEVKAQRS